KAQYILTTPKGGMYSITLPDGSKVWLNAGTTLKYPSQFDDHERVVYLEGEAYFDIKRQPSKRRAANGQRLVKSIPFKVISNGQTVQVIGTEFNISAYADEPGMKTTLITGSVQIINSQSGGVNRL